MATETVPCGLPALVDTLRGDAARMEEYAQTLRATAATLGDLDEAPGWSGPVLQQQAAACLVAAEQLRTAALALEAHARAARSRTTSGWFVRLVRRASPSGRQGR
ncbi:hypothetical protein OG562_34035 [Streptomyces sp. NBC_01275]|uniref:hypothetical protein n=1 Tax=Streptomyces sp. NBC_01275 TaxID=2903807 RepID=UPI002256B68A|nr:hypothetical protein [Streptomyces sp. NBC_01275]MCX4765914.1 hypothetical protein [Streptomyces sp. NBC_01275]